MNDMYEEQLIKKEANAVDRLKKAALIALTVLSAGAVLFYPFAVFLTIVLIEIGRAHV